MAIGGPPITFIGVPIFIPIPIVSVSVVGAPVVNGFEGIGKAIVISINAIGPHKKYVKIQLTMKLIYEMPLFNRHEQSC